MASAQATPFPYKYCIQATIEKPGGTPVSWIRFQNTPMTKQECEKLFSTEKEAGNRHERYPARRDGGTGLCNEPDS